MPNQHPKGQGKTIQELTAGITPMLPGQPERIPWTWFDTQTYVSATTTRLDFFQTVNADKVLSNMVAAGQIPSPQFFDLYHCSICYLIPFSAIAAAADLAITGALNDVDRLSQGAASFSVANKDYWQGPQLALPCGGGANAVLFPVECGSRRRTGVHAVRLERQPGFTEPIQFLGGYHHPGQPELYLVAYLVGSVDLCASHQPGD